MFQEAAFNEFSVTKSKSRAYKIGSLRMCVQLQTHYCMKPNFQGFSAMTCIIRYFWLCSIFAAVLNSVEKSEMRKYTL